MFELYPQIIIVVAFAIIIFIIARKFPKIGQENIEEVIKEEQKKKELKSRKKSLKSMIQGDSSQEGKIDDSVLDQKEDEVKKAREHEKKQALETKKQLHSNVLKVIDRLVILGKKTWTVLNTKFLALVNFLRARKASFKRRKKTSQEVEGEKIIDLLERAAKESGAGELKTAEKNYIEVIKLDPKNIRAYKGLGEVYEKQKNFRDAIASYQEAFKRDPLDRKVEAKLVELRNKN